MQQESTTPRDVRVPIRTCVGCRARRPRADLCRFVVDADGSVRRDASGSGRGAWLCGPDCWDEAVRRGGFDRAFRRRVDGLAPTWPWNHENDGDGADRPSVC